MDKLDYTRAEALERQRILHHNRCKDCPYRNCYRYTDQCELCPVKAELLSIGYVLDATVCYLTTSRKMSSKKAVAHWLRLPAFYIDFRNFSIT